MSKKKQENDATEASNESHKLERIMVQRQIVRRAQDEVDEQHTIFKSAKSILESEMSTLLRLIDEDDSQLELPFSDPEAWRIESIEVLGLSKKAASALRDGAGLSTIGLIADWTAEHPLKDIAGVGEAVANEIEQALERYWEKNKPGNGDQDGEDDEDGEELEQEQELSPHED